MACALVLPAASSSSDHTRPVEIAADRNSPQKHVWRAQIVLLPARACNHEIKRHGNAKTYVWR